MKEIEISALAFNKNFFKFRKDVEQCLKYKITHLHFDVMDNRFVPNTSFQKLEKLNYLIKKNFKISVHLMVQDVESYLKRLVFKKINYITFHCESQSIEKGVELIRYARSKGIKCGIAIKPKTDLNEYSKLINMSDIITIMSVEPGFGGQKYIEGSTNRIREIKKYCKENCIIQIDGGINQESLEKVKNFANLIVSGSFLYKNMEKYEELKKWLDQ